MTQIRQSEGAASAPVVRGDGSGDFSNSFPISLGYIAEAQAALLKMQENYVKIGQLQNQTDMLLLASQRGDGKNGQLGTVMAIATAIQNSAFADEKNSFLDAGSEASEVAGSLANAGISKYYSASDANQENEAQQDLSNARTFESKFNTVQPAGRGIGDAPAELTPAQKVRLNEITEGQGPVEYKEGDEQILQHVRANDQQRAAVTKRINEAKHDANTRLNSIQSHRQMSQQYYNSFVGAGQHTAAMGLNVAKGYNNANNKGPADALRAVAQASDQNVSQNVSQVLDQAKQSYQDAAQLNQIRTALGSNNGTAGQ